MNITQLTVNEKQLDALKEIGNEWQKGNYHRIYINNSESRVGLKISRYNSGNISYAELNGEKISNSSANKMIARLTSVKVYYDINEKNLVIQNSEKLYDEEIEAITESIINEMNKMVGEEVEEIGITEVSNNNNQINEGDLQIMSKVFQYRGDMYGPVRYNTTLEKFLASIQDTTIFGEDADKNELTYCFGHDDNDNCYDYYEDSKTGETLLIEVNESTIECGLVSADPPDGSEID